MIIVIYYYDYIVISKTRILLFVSLTDCLINFSNNNCRSSKILKKKKKRIHIYILKRLYFQKQIY
jgi:hypothetical protein